TDMSEIVRPTRDGIHGREYISTCFEISRRISPLKFNADMTLASKPLPILEIPIPLMLRLPDDLIINSSIVESAARAAQMTGTFLMIRPSDYSDALSPYARNLVPCLSGDNLADHVGLIRQCRAIELAYGKAIEDNLRMVRDVKSDIALIVRIPLNADAPSRALKLSALDIDTLHFYADEHGNELDTEHPRFLKDMIREVHLKLVNGSARQKINLVFSGGIAMAEHMAKAIICGADGVVMDIPLLIALECRLCYRCRKDLSCPAKIDDAIDPQWGSQRMINLIGAWHSQLIEVMGAMGIREARRLRGEVGRSMWFEDLEKDSFGPLFGKRKIAGLK
ncbi:MAG: glutamate synthase-related protein, partial [Desulfobacterales bacterium]